MVRWTSGHKTGWTRALMGGIDGNDNICIVYYCSTIYCDDRCDAADGVSANAYSVTRSSDVGDMSDDEDPPVTGVVFDDRLSWR